MKPLLFNSKFCVVLTIALTLAFVDSAMAGADLAIDNISIANRPTDNIYHPGDSLSVGGSITNIGDETSDSYVAYFYAGGYLIGTRSDHGLAAGVTGGFGASCSLPSDIPYGTYTIYVEISCSNDSNSDNNSASDPEDIIVAEVEPPTPPDLWFEQISLYGYINPYYPGDSLSVSCTVRNIGELASEGYSIDVYAGDYSIGSTSRNGLGPDDADYFSISCSLPYDIPEGYHSIWGDLSCSNDSDSGNNSDSDRSIRVAIKGPTYVEIQSVDAADGVYEPGESIEVDVVTEGSGGQLENSFEIDVYISEDSEITTSDKKIHNFGGGTISPGETLYLEATCRLPSDMTAGEYYIGIIVTYPVEGGSRSVQSCDYNTVYIGGPSDLKILSMNAADGRYEAGDQIEVYNLIKNIGEWPSSSYTVSYYASANSSITSDDYNIGHTQRSGLAPGEQHSYETTCVFPRNIPVGTYYIGAIVICSNDDNPGNNQAHDSIKVRIAVPVVPPGSISGQMNYQDIEGNRHPIRYALVEVYHADNNSDPLDDRALGHTHTDQNGNYDIVVSAEGIGAQEFYIKVFTESVGGAYPETAGRICTVRDDVFDEVYYMQSENYPVPEEALLTVDMCAPNDVGEFMVYDSIVEGFEKAKKFFEIELDEVMAYWPCEEESSYFDPCEGGIYIAQEDRGDRDIIMHEYGHHIAQEYLFAQGDVGENSTHAWNADLRKFPDNFRSYEQAKNLAFREAWASLFSIATQYGDTGYPNSGDRKYQDVDEGSDETFEVDLEMEDCYNYKPGEYFENMNCCALWDIFDDESLGDSYLDMLSDLSLSKIWTTLVNYQPEDIIDFCESWFENYEYEREMKYIFRAHNIPFSRPEPPAEPVVNNPPVADAGPDQTVEQTYARGAEVYVDGSGSYDPDGDPLTYEWSCDVDRAVGSSADLTIPPGTTTVRLQVYDGQDYDYDTVDITVIPTDPETWIVE